MTLALGVQPPALMSERFERMQTWHMGGWGPTLGQQSS